MQMKKNIIADLLFMFGNFFRKIYQFYQKRYTLFSGITSGIFLFQFIHLFWLTTFVVWHRLFGFSIFNPNEFWQLAIIFVDYLEIPAIIATSYLYVHNLLRKYNKKDVFLLILLNTQWLHIFWISDEFVKNVFVSGQTGTILPVWLAWLAIFIDYLELPVMHDTIKKFIQSVSLKKYQYKQEI